jgi:hypothetical protein
VAHHPWAWKSCSMTRDLLRYLRFIDDDVIVWGNPGNWPAARMLVSRRAQGIMPNGQARLTLRRSDQP